MKLNKQQIKEFKELMTRLPDILNYINSSKLVFIELNKILENIDLSDKDKIIMINNKLKEFEVGILNGFSN